MDRICGADLERESRFFFTDVEGTRNYVIRRPGDLWRVLRVCKRKEGKEERAGCVAVCCLAMFSATAVDPSVGYSLVFLLPWGNWGEKENYITWYHWKKRKKKNGYQTNSSLKSNPWQMLLLFIPLAEPHRNMFTNIVSHVHSGMFYM